MYNIVGKTCTFLMAMLLAFVTVRAADSLATASGENPVTIGAAPATLTMYGVNIATLYSSVLSSEPAQRVEVTRGRITEALDNMNAGAVTIKYTLNGTAFMLDGRPTVFLTALDYDPTLHKNTKEIESEVSQNLQLLVSTWQEQRSMPDILLGIGLVIVATIVMYFLTRFLLFVRRRTTRRMLRVVVRRLHSRGMREIANSARFIPIAIIRVIALVTYVLIVLLLYVYVTFSLNRFPITRTLGHQMRDIVFSSIASMADETIAAIPSMISLILIFLIARFTARWVTKVLGGVERNQYTLPGVDRDTVMPTRRILVTGIWAFAFALAYPFIPGSSSQAFQGVSVLFGLMISLGASGSIGQAMSGLILLYSRSMRVGDYVTVGEVSGRVLRIGFFAVRLRTAYQQEITIPNTVLVTTTILNHTRMTPHGTSYTTIVTIGYDAPWRLVQEMLLEATRRIEYIEQSHPAPYVTQHALTDFAVEYRLTCVFTDPDTRRAAYNALHAAIQDVFNENDVQIMSPHYEADPEAPKVVPESTWAQPLLKRKTVQHNQQPRRDDVS